MLKTQDLEPSAATIEAAVIASLSAARREAEPFEHLIVQDLLPADAARALSRLPYQPPRLDGLSGKRELHNDQRIYFDARSMAAHPVCAAIAGAFQGDAVVRAFQAATGARLAGSRLRVEYAVDGEGFWLNPHTDLGVKALTLLAPLPQGPDQGQLGTDLYRAPGEWARRVPFTAGLGLIFVPGDDTWHGFEPRPIPTPRRSLIVNYVIDGWRDLDQLAFPTRPVLS